MSSTSGFTPPISNKMFHGYRHGEPISLGISSASQQRRHTHSYDLIASSSTKYSSDKSNDKGHLLHPHPISSEIKQSLLALHRKSVDNLRRTSMDNSSVRKSPTFYSTNDISRPKHNATHDFIGKKQCVRESPV